MSSFGDPEYAEPQPQPPPVEYVAPVYAIGELSPRFPSIGVEKEFGQLAGDPEFAGIADDALLASVFEKPENAYLAPHLCWVVSTQGLDAFSIVADDVPVSDLLAAAAQDRHVVVIGSGRIGGCLGPGVMAVRPTQMLSFTTDEFVEHVTGGSGADAKKLVGPVREVFERARRRNGNVGIGADHRALNYVVLRYPDIYQRVAAELGNGGALTGLDTRHVHASGRAVVEIGLSFRHPRKEGVSRWSCRVDATELFPFLVSPLEEYFDY